MYDYHNGDFDGSLLGTLLFLLFADDLSNAVETSRVACYADDTKVFKSIDSIIDCNILQSDLNNLVSWSESSGLIFNQSRQGVNTIASPAKDYLYNLPILSTKRLWNLRHRERPWRVGVKQSYLGQTSIRTVCESQQIPWVCAPSF